MYNYYFIHCFCQTRINTGFIHQCIKLFGILGSNNTRFLSIISPILSIYWETSFTFSHRSMRPSGYTRLVMLPAPNATMVCTSSIITPNRSLHCIIVYYLIFPLFQNSIIEYYIVPCKGHLLELCWTSPFCVGLAFYRTSTFMPSRSPLRNLSLNIELK